MRRALLLTLLLTMIIPVVYSQEEQCVDCDEKAAKISWIRRFLPFYFSHVRDVVDNLLPIKNVEYKQNLNASYCKRSLDYLTTVVLHHTGESPKSGPERINQLHLYRGGSSDPWRMVGYNYLISDRYDQNGESEIFTGRPLDVVGAHAGVDSFSNRVSDATKKKMKQDGIRCGKSETSMTKKAVPMNARGEVNTNVESVGVAIMGSYSRLTADNPGGYIGKKRYPGDTALLNVAKLICSLQKKYKTLKYIKLHKEVRPDPTGCPGLVEKKVGKIKAYAKAQGCIFE